MLVWKAYARMIDALAFGPDGRALALAGCYLTCRVIDPFTGARVWTVGSSSAFGLSLAFAPGRGVLCRGGGLSVRDPDTGADLHNTGRWCQSFALAPDGRTAVLADGGYANSVRNYDLETGRTLDEVELEAGAVNRVAVAPDGELVALVGCKRFYLLSANGLEVVASAADRTLSSGAFALAFAPDGNTLVWSAGRTLFVWDVAGRREVARVVLDSKHFMDAAFTPDGRHLITVSKEGVARMWGTATWACERAFAWNVGPLRAVAVSPDGARAACAGDQGRVVVWDLDL